MSLAHNKLSNGVYFTSLAHYIPGLVNLSLEGNSLRTFRDLDYLSGRKGKLEKLRELILKGNPIREIEYQNNRIGKYKRYSPRVAFRVRFLHMTGSEVARRFPALDILDQEPVVKIGFDVPHASTSKPAVALPAATTFPYYMMPSLITGVDGGFVSRFLTRYVPSAVDSHIASLFL